MVIVRSFFIERHFKNEKNPKCWSFSECLVLFLLQNEWACWCVSKIMRLRHPNKHDVVYPELMEKLLSLSSTQTGCSEEYKTVTDWWWELIGSNWVIMYLCVCVVLYCTVPVDAWTASPLLDMFYLTFCFVDAVSRWTHPCFPWLWDVIGRRRQQPSLAAECTSRRNEVSSKFDWAVVKPHTL